MKIQAVRVNYKLIIIVLFQGEDPSLNFSLHLNLTSLIEASRGVQNPNVLLEKFSQNRKVDDPTRALLLTFYGILVVIGGVGNALVVISVSPFT